MRTAYLLDITLFAVMVTIPRCGEADRPTLSVPSHVPRGRQLVCLHEKIKRLSSFLSVEPVTR
jgi:hypothetical protein